MTNWFKLFALKFLQVESVIIKIFDLSSDSSPLTGVVMSIGSRSGVVVGNEEGGVVQTSVGKFVLEIEVILDVVALSVVGEVVVGEVVGEEHLPSMH